MNLLVLSFLHFLLLAFVLVLIFVLVIDFGIGFVVDFGIGLIIAFGVGLVIGFVIDFDVVEDIIMIVIDIVRGGLLPERIRHVVVQVSSCLNLAPRLSLSLRLGANRVLVC